MIPSNVSDSAMEACAQAKAMAEELGKQTRGIKVDMFRVRKVRFKPCG